MTKRVQLIAAIVVALLIAVGVAELARTRRIAKAARAAAGGVPATRDSTPAAEVPSGDAAERDRRAKLTALPIADRTAYANLHGARTTVHDDLRIVSGLIENYLSSLGPAGGAGHAPPLGFNEDIMRALTGENPLGVAFLPADHPAIDAQGRLLDRWGTPYFFHPLSASRIEVRSAGADRKLFTADDGVLAPAIAGAATE